MSITDIFSVDNSDTILDLGLQPVTNRFLKSTGERAPFYPLKLCQCRKTGAIFLQKPFPIEEIRPRFAWMAYNEPEGHLDQMVGRIGKDLGINASSIVGGVSSKDDTTIKRFERLGATSWRLDLVSDLDIHTPGAGVESIQEALTTRSGANLGSKLGCADLLVVRHIFEHAYDLQEFSSALKKLTKPGGHILIEIPDCTRALELFDYTTVWEEHTFYFTPHSFRLALESCGFEIVYFEVYPYPFESSLVAVVRATNSASPNIDEESLGKELARGRLFGAKFPEYKSAILNYFARSCGDNGKGVLLGAGHLACTFISLFELSDYLECIIDDNPNKQGLFMPFGGIPILPSKILYERNIKRCFLGLNPIAEESVVAKNGIFVDNGGEFFSIFPGSSRSLYRSLEILNDRGVR